MPIAVVPFQKKKNLERGYLMLELLHAVNSKYADADGAETFPTARMEFLWIRNDDILLETGSIILYCCYYFFWNGIFFCVQYLKE